MVYLENIEELDIFKVTGLMQICKANRDIIFGYGLYSRKEFYNAFEDLLNNQIKIKIPDLEEKYYITKTSYIWYHA